MPDQTFASPESQTQPKALESKVPAAPKMELAGMEQFRAFLGMVSRTRLGRLLTSFGGKRDYNSIFGWDPTLDALKFLTMYNRGSIAKRVVDAYPDALWARPPQIWAPEDDAWTANWAKMVQAWGLWQAIHRLDRLCHLGQYSILVIGTDRGKLSDPIVKAGKITYVQPYGEYSVQINTYDADPMSPNFGKPQMYQVYPEGAGLMVTGTGRGLIQPTGSQIKSTRSSFQVHASRVIHVCRDPLEDEVFGQPIMAPIWDLLTDLRKVVGSSSESYWINANRGLQADIDKEMSLNAEDQAALQTEIDEYFHGYRRFMRTKGVKLNELHNDVSDPKSPFEVLVTLISGTTGIPQRILTGSEAGQLASTQDKGNWAERVEEARNLHAEPRILRPFLSFCLKSGVIAPPTGGDIQLNWPDAYRMSPLERGMTSAQTARTIANVTKMLESKSERAQNLLKDEEIRALIGVSTDNRILSDNPNP